MTEESILQIASRADFHHAVQGALAQAEAAESREILITRHGKPAGVLIGFASEDDWFDYRLENDPRFIERIAAARESLRRGHGVALEDADI